MLSRPCVSICTRPSQNRCFIAPMLKSGGAFRGMKIPDGSVRPGPIPAPPCPMERLRPSPVANSGRWQVVQDMSRLPLRILSKASAWPNLASGGLTNGAGGSATTPRPAASSRTSAAVTVPVAGAAVLGDADGSVTAAGLSAQFTSGATRMATAKLVFHVARRITPQCSGSLPDSLERAHPRGCPLFSKSQSRWRTGHQDQTLPLGAEIRALTSLREGGRDGGAGAPSSSPAVPSVPRLAAAPRSRRT